MKKVGCLGWLKHEAKRFSMTPITFLLWRGVLRQRRVLLWPVSRPCHFVVELSYRQQNIHFVFVGVVQQGFGW